MSGRVGPVFTPGMPHQVQPGSSWTPQNELWLQGQLTSARSTSTSDSSDADEHAAAWRPVTPYNRDAAAIERVCAVLSTALDSTMHSRVEQQAIETSLVRLGQGSDRKYKGSAREMFNTLGRLSLRLDEVRRLFGVYTRFQAEADAVDQAILRAATVMGRLTGGAWLGSVRTPCLPAEVQVYCQLQVDVSPAIRHARFVMLNYRNHHERQPEVNPAPAALATLLRAVLNSSADSSDFLSTGAGQPLLR